MAESRLVFGFRQNCREWLIVPPLVIAARMLAVIIVTGNEQIPFSIDKKPICVELGGESGLAVEAVN